MPSFKVFGMKHIVWTTFRYVHNMKSAQVTSVMDQDGGSTTILVHLELLVIFDNINHSVLIDWL